MTVHRTFHDEIWGRVIWDAKSNCWHFNTGPINGKTIPAAYVPEDDSLPPADPSWDPRSGLRSLEPSK
jgi:hypothetical protein